MGRSVDYLNDAEFVAYIDRSEANEIACEHCGSTNVTKLDEDNDDGHNHSCDNCDKTFEGYEPDAEFEWEAFEESIFDILSQRCPSLNLLRTRKERRWDGRETSIIAENNLCEIGISEYCGLASLSIRIIRDDYVWRYEALAKQWIAKVWPGIQKMIVEYFPESALRRIGGMSNGCGVYEQIKKAS